MSVELVDRKSITGVEVGRRDFEASNISNNT